MIHQQEHQALNKLTTIKSNLIPVADPNAATMAQKVVQYQAVMQMAQQNPTIYDLPELNKQMLDCFRG